MNLNVLIWNIKNESELPESNYYDIIMTQNIENIKEIMNYYYIHSSNNNYNIVTYYNYSNIRILFIKTGIINNNTPYHILFCQIIRNNQYIIIINLNINSEISRHDLQTEISNNITNGWIVPSSINNCINCQQNKSDDIDKIKQILNNFNVNNTCIIINSNYNINDLQPFIFCYDYNIRYIVASKLITFSEYNILSSNNIKPKYEESNKNNLGLNLQLELNDNNIIDEHYKRKYLKYKKKYLKYKM